MTKCTHGSVASVLVCTFCLGTFGCGDESGGKPVTLVQVSGVVTINGRPLVGAYVEFFPEKGPKAYCAETGPGGVFNLKTGTKYGCTVGPATVSVHMPDEGASATRAPVIKGGAQSPAEFAEQSQKMAEMTTAVQRVQASPPRSLVPERYHDPRSSGITFTIERGGAKGLKIELKD